ncbi:hypothetical protein [Phaffia rhodozyma]|uniref:Uncharacterized protein n=1 Tax=Phaffia rhodozyma TaxID=264483 RepID=A0A0F7SLW7_PHARH|nr:hypothetical protein [Phaffia rhodozyma]
MGFINTTLSLFFVPLVEPVYASKPAVVELQSYESRPSFSSSSTAQAHPMWSLGDRRLTRMLLPFKVP